MKVRMVSSLRSSVVNLECAWVSTMPLMRDGDVLSRGTSGSGQDSHSYVVGFELDGRTGDKMEQRWSKDGSQGFCHI